jgi:hypothetical protein
MSITPTAGKSDFHQLWTLRHRRPYKQTPFDPPRTARKSEEYILRNQVFSCRNEIVKHILFLHFGSRIMPFFRIRHHLVN